MDEVTFTEKEDRMMAMALYYYNSGASDLVAFAVIVKLMTAAGITPTGTYQDPTEKIPE